MKMAKISIQGNVSKVTATRAGNEIVILKKIKKASVAETHPAPINKRVNGKQKSPELTAFSAADLRAIAATDLAAKEAAKKEADAKEKQLKDKIEKLENKSMNAETKRRMMEGSAKTETNAETAKIKKQYKKSPNQRNQTPNSISH